MDDRRDAAARRGLPVARARRRVRGSPLTVRYPPSTATSFAAELEAAVAGYFRDRNLSIKATPGTWAKVAFLWIWAIAAYAAVIAPGLSWLERWAACVALGAAFAGIGMAVGHDAQHGSLSHRDLLNRLAGLSFDALGANGYIWRFTHNRIHHVYPNIEGLDLDLDFGTALRASPSEPLRPWHRFQFIYAFPLYGTLFLNWIFLKDLKYFCRRTLGPYRDLRHPAREWAFFLGTRALVLGYAVAVPLLVLRPALWQLALGFFTTYYVQGLLTAFVLQFGHVVEGPALIEPAPRMADPFLAHQLRTTANFACTNRLLSAYVGGLNFQVEHHLFPHVCSAHYPALRPIVRELARKHGLPYYEHPTVWAALRSHLRLLYRMGRPEAVAEAAPARAALSRAG